MIEPVFGDIKENRGIRRFQRRGFEACASEWKLIAATHNLRKLYRHGLKQPCQIPPVAQRSNRPWISAARVLSDRTQRLASLAVAEEQPPTDYSAIASGH